jgi:hypothetical protein
MINIPLLPHLSVSPDQQSIFLNFSCVILFDFSATYSRRWDFLVVVRNRQIRVQASIRQKGNWAFI